MNAANVMHSLHLSAKTILAPQTTGSVHEAPAEKFPGLFKRALRSPELGFGALGVWNAVGTALRN
jgi:hypothetical protein